MYDFDTHLRFMTSATEAAFGYAAATLAAASAWQDQLANAAKPAPAAADILPIFNPFQLMQPWMAFWPGAHSQQSPRSSPLSMWFPAMPAMGSANFAMGEFGAPFFRFAQPAQNWNAFAHMPGNVWQNDWADTVRACCWAWPQSSWMMWHQPMTAALMGFGMPYSVASPTARANAAAMDAADAARDTWKSAFSSYQSSGGHASAQIGPWINCAMIAIAPWLAFVPKASPF